MRRKAGNNIYNKRMNQMPYYRHTQQQLSKTDSAIGCVSRIVFFISLVPYKKGQGDVKNYDQKNIIV